jgi:hypothetical protein
MSAFTVPKLNRRERSSSNDPSDLTVSIARNIQQSLSVGNHRGNHKPVLPSITKSKSKRARMERIAEKLKEVKRRLEEVRQGECPQGQPGGRCAMQGCCMAYPSWTFPSAYPSYLPYPPYPFSPFSYPIGNQLCAQCSRKPPKKRKRNHR